MIRFYFVNLLSDLGRFLETLYPAILRPKQLIELEKRGYQGGYRSKENREIWLKRAEKGLTQPEKYLVENFTDKRGNLLILKSGSGRESLCLAKLGFNVTGLEWVGELAEFASKKAEESRVDIRYIQGDIFDLEKLSERFDYVMLSAGDYSAIISRELRIKWLKKLKDILNKKSKVFLGYLVAQPTNFEKKTYRLRRLIAFLTLGNFNYQSGDRKITNMPVFHYFLDHSEVAGEAEEAGFKIIRTRLEEEKSGPWIVLEAGESAQ